jgi:hypothetical protein
MTWVSFSDEWNQAPEIIDLPDAVRVTFEDALFYAARHLTDGHVVASALRHRAPSSIRGAVERGLLRPRSEGGWFIPQWLDHIEDRATVLDRREKAKQRKRTQRARERGDVTGGVTP